MGDGQGTSDVYRQPEHSTQAARILSKSQVLRLSGLLRLSGRKSDIL